LFKSSARTCSNKFCANTIALSCEIAIFSWNISTACVPVNVFISWSITVVVVRSLLKATRFSHVAVLKSLSLSNARIFFSPSHYVRKVFSFSHYVTKILSHKRVRAGAKYRFAPAWPSYCRASGCVDLRTTPHRAGESRLIFRSEKINDH